MRVLLTGASGQVGQAVLAAAPSTVRIRALTHRDLDIGDEAAVHERMSQERPELIINAAAYTAVDRAESERDAANRVNADGPRHLARAAEACGARLIHLSTDYVFDGTASEPYVPEAATRPLNVYGASKLAGERAALEASKGRALVLRTAWIYSARGASFLATMLRLMRERGRVRVVADQTGTPTAAASVASALWTLAPRSDIQGIEHWTDAGIASWYDFACAIAEQATHLGLLSGAVSVEPISTAEYPTAARRPAYSVLDSTRLQTALGLRPSPWRERLRSTLETLAHG